jgi:hypothetical protein
MGATDGGWHGALGPVMVDPPIEAVLSSANASSASLGNVSELLDKDLLP